MFTLRLTITVSWQGRRTKDIAMIDDEITLKKLEVFLSFMRLHSLSRVAARAR
jgi:hypothetical protein